MGFHPGEDGVAVGDEQGDSIRGLIIIEHHLVNVLRLAADSLLDSFGTVFLAIVGDQEAFGSAKHIEESVFINIAKVAGVQPAVDDGFACGFFVVPVARHHVFAFHDDLSLLAAREVFPLLVADPNLKVAARWIPKSRACAFQNVGRDDGCGFGEPVSLQHRYADRIEESLQLNVQERPPPMKNSSLPPKFSRIFLKRIASNSFTKRLKERAPSFAPVPADAVVEKAHCKPGTEKLSATAPLFLTPASMFFLKFFASVGTLKRNVGRVSLMLAGMFFSVSIGDLPTWTDAMLAPLRIRV